LNPANNTGQQTLEAISKAERFNQWMYDTIRPYCYGNILEVGSGIGNISSFFVQNNFQITLSDVDDQYLQTLTNKYATTGNVKEIILLDLENADFENAYKDKQNFFDTVFLLNVLEHIKDDNKAVHNCKYLLKNGGTLIILVPAYSWLYARLDKMLSHYRRYNLQELKNIFESEGLTIRKQFYFNATGILGWLYGKLFRLSAVPSTEMKVYDKIVPFGKLVDKIVLGKIGLSAIIIAEK
jgi:2-polyprenyl-3-methyl-5-hydroxy-6-metoxy-1,4-benzoquinol methylase